MEAQFANHLLKQLIIKHREQRHMEALQTLQDQMEKGYTVVGFYRDNDQPWVGFVEEAHDTMDAARQAILSTSVYQEAHEDEEEEENLPADIVVVEVFKGRQVGIMNPHGHGLPDQTLRLKDLKNK